MEDGLSEMWGKFSLHEDEDAGISLETAELVPVVNRGQGCIIGKIMADRIVPKEFFKTPITRMWRLIGSVSFRVIGDNLFLAEFEHCWEKDRVMEGRPWIFDGNLILLAVFDGITPPLQMIFETESFWLRMFNLPLACMGREVVQKIGSSVGFVEEIDILDDEVGWGEYVRVKVRMNLSKPLARGRMLHLPHQSTWVAFKFERLPKFCFRCGVICHGKEGCSRQGYRPHGKEEDYPYGNWLKVSYPTRRRQNVFMHEGQGMQSKQNVDKHHGGDEVQPELRPGYNSPECAREEVTPQCGGDGSSNSTNPRVLQTAVADLETPRITRNNGGQAAVVVIDRVSVQEKTGTKAKIRKSDLTEATADQLLKDMEGNFEMRETNLDSDKGIPKIMQKIQMPRVSRKEATDAGSSVSIRNNDKVGQGHTGGLLKQNMVEVIEVGNIVGQKKWAKKATQPHKQSFVGPEIGDKIKEPDGVLSSKKILGTWDSNLGGMKWTRLGSEQDIQLVLDPQTQSYLPRVCSTITDSTSKAELLTEKESLELSFPGPNAQLCSPSTNSHVESRKRRARSSRLLEEASEVSAKDGSCLAIARVEEGGIKKKGRQESVQNSLALVDQAEAVVQPRHAP